MKSLVTLFFLALLSSLSAQKPATPTPATVEEAMKPADRFQASIAIAKASLTKLSEWIDAWEKEVNAVPPDATTTDARTSNLNLSKSNRQVRGAPVVTSRSNIKQMTQKLDDLAQSDPAKRANKLKELQGIAADLDVSIQSLHDSILLKGESYAAKAGELKEKHETVKNSIQNIR